MVRNKAMTLAEVMISLFVLLLLSGSIAVILNTYAVFNFELDDRIDLYDNARSLHDLMYRELVHALSVNAGTIHTIDVTSKIMDEIHTYSYRYSTREKSIFRSVDGEDEVCLAGNVRSFKYTFYDREGLVISPPIDLITGKQVACIDIKSVLRTPDASQRNVRLKSTCCLKNMNR